MKLFRLIGTDVYLNPFFLALLALFFVAGVLVKGLIAFGIVFIHEFAHVILARKLGIEVTRVELLPFGGVARMGGEISLDPRTEAKVAAAGPACNFFMVLLAVALKNHNIWHNDLAPFFIQCNLLVACFNLLPALPLDGGRVLRAYLAEKKGLGEATRIAAGYGQKWAVVVALFGFAGIYLGATGIDISLTALFLFYAATREKNMAPFLFINHLVRKKDELLKSGMLPARVMVALENVPLGQIVKGFLPQKYHLVVVVDSGGQIKARATESEIVEKIVEGGLETPAGRLKG